MFQSARRSAIYVWLIRIPYACDCIANLIQAGSSFLRNPEDDNFRKVQGEARLTRKYQRLKLGCDA
jgi:hypothetical protein